MFRENCVKVAQLSVLCHHQSRHVETPSGALGNQSVCTANANCILWSLNSTGHLENAALSVRYYLKSACQ